MNQARKLAPIGVSLSILLLAVLFSDDAQAFGKKRAPAPPSFSPPPLQPGGPGQFRLRVMTYNVWGLPGIIGNDPARFPEIGKVLKKRRAGGRAPHIVAIQEAFSDCADQIAQVSGYPYRVDGPDGNLVKLKSGISILSEFPLSETDFYQFEHCATTDCFGKKGVLHAKVKIPGMGTKLDVYTTHMQANPSGDPITPIAVTERVRMRQIPNIARFLDETRNQAAPVIFAGDFNMTPDLGSYRKFDLMIWFQNAAEVCAFRYPCGGDPGAADYWRSSLDHQFYQDSLWGGARLRPIRFSKEFDEPVGGRMLSDHIALEMHYELKW